MNVNLKYIFFGMCFFSLTSQSQTGINSNLLDDLLVWMPFNGNSLDYSVNQNNGTVYNETSSGVTLVQDRFWNENSAYRFNGNGGYDKFELPNLPGDRIVIPSSTSLESLDSDFTISFWFRPSSSLSGNLIDRDLCGYANDWGLQWSGSNVIFRTRYDNYPSDPIPTGSWHHVIGTRQNNIFSLYVNGDLHFNTEINYVFTNTNIPITIGDQTCESIEPSFQGSIDDIGIWSRAINIEELQSIECLINDENCACLVDTDGDGVCDEAEINGCTDTSACNYDLTSTDDDGSCTFPTESYLDCYGDCVNDTDGDGVCDEVEIVGCTDSTAINFNSNAGCDDGSCIPAFGTLIWNTTASMYYSDTLEVNIEITGGVDVYAAFASLQYNESLLLMVEDNPGDYLGTDVISSPAVDNNGVVEFGVTKVGSVAGSNGDGLFYTLRFIPVGPIEFTSTQTLLSILNIEAYTSDGLPGALYYPESWEVEIVYEAEVWPGDLNHDLEVNVSDILPIGYFYGETGPTRPDASLQWEAQLCPLWDIGMEFPGDGFYKVFADGNGDGEIQLSDQVAVGFNINQVVNFIPELDNTAMLLGGGSAPVMITSNSTPATVMLPDDTEVSITLMATTDETNQNDFHGISWSMDFSSLGIDANEVVIDYSNSGMGELNNTMIALDYSSGSQLDIAITRTTSDYNLGTFELCTVTIPMSGLNSGDYIVPVMVSEANDVNGFSVSTSSSNTIITVSNASGCTDIAACNYSPEASEDDGSCQYVLVYNVNGSLTPGLFESEAYLYYETEGSTYEWVCTGGVIISGNGSFQIEVTWAEQGIGELCVVETNAEGCVGEQICIDVAVIPTNIGEEEQVNISIFPNPASTSFTISADDRFINTTYRLFDSQGKLVLQGTISANTTLVQTNDFSSGNYTLSISNGKQIVTETIFLQE